MTVEQGFNEEFESLAHACRLFQHAYSLADNEDEDLMDVWNCTELIIEHWDRFRNLQTKPPTP